VAAYRRLFLEALNEDLNTPQAIAVLFDLAREGNQVLAAGGITEAARAEITAFLDVHAAGILGLAAGDDRPQGTSRTADDLVGLLITLRNEARARKDWATADAVRNGLTALGIVLEDKKDGTVWKHTGGA
jgi:cysteinyl-tRNA synthetase